MRYLIGLGILAVAVSLVTAVTQVRPDERVVVRRFGRVVATPGPGLWIGLPWGLDRVDRVSVDRVRRVVVGYQPDEEENYQTTPAGQLLTGDHNLVNVQVVVHYSVDEARVVSFVEQGEERAEALIARAAEAVVAEWVAGRKIDDVLLQGKVVLSGPTQAVATDRTGLVATRTQQRLGAYRLGVQILDAEVAHLYPPREVKDAFDAVNAAQTAIQKKEQEALQAASRRRREAETRQFQIERSTESYVRERLQLARAEADRFEKRLEQYQRLGRTNPEFLLGLWWEEIGQLFARLQESGRIDMLDNHLGPDGLDITQFPPNVKKK
jgi:membrane protease subunit HflK